MLILLVKASLVLIIMLAFYKLFLEKESFFALNRIYLLACLVFACTLPFIALPKLTVYQGAITRLITLSEKQVTTISNFENIKSSEGELLKINTSEPSSPSESINMSNTLQSEGIVDVQHSFKQSPANGRASKLTTKSLSEYLMIFYFIGVIIFSILLLVQMMSILRKVIGNEDKIVDEESILVNIHGAIDPCSFFRYIFINPASYDYATYEQIIAHEKIHVRKRHTIDLLLSELAIVLLWFNPFVWLLRREVEKNIEYQTDNLLIKTNTAKKEDYQMNLLRIASHTRTVAITTNYNQSLIKQRILKMNAKKSNNSSYWKYALIAPLVFILLLGLNLPKAGFAQGKGVLNPSNSILDQTSLATTLNIVQNGTEPQEPTAEIETTSQQEEYIANVDDECGNLLKAIRKQDISKVEALLKTVDVNCLDSNPGYEEIVREGQNIMRYQHAQTPLTTAARVGKLEIGKLLLNAGAKVDFHAEHRASPLVEASAGGYTDFAILLLDNGADLNKMDQGHGSALHAAARNGHLETVRYLLDKGANINASNNGQGSVLNGAARNGHVETVVFLLDEGADINSQNNGQGSALNAAARNGQKEIVELLLARGADINAHTNGQGSALSAAARNGQNEILALLLDKGADIDASSPGQGSALDAAIRNGNKEGIEILIAKGADVNVKTNQHGTPLQTAAGNGHRDIVELLLNKGADINAQTNGQGSALNAAARNGQKEMVELLLARGADIDAYTNGQGSALNAAARNGQNEILELLLARGADVNASSPGHGSALDAAIRNGNKASIDLLIAKGADINVQTTGYGSPLHTAARMGNKDMVKFLLKKGVDIDASTPGEGTALNAAVRNGHKEVVTLLIEKGADVNSQAPGAGTALNAAARNGQLEIVKLLVSKGADVNLKSYGHGTPLSAARRNNQTEVVQYLESIMAK